LLSNRGFLLALLFLIVFNSLVLGYFHNRFWWPPDDGVYAHTAERMLHGEVLNKDVEEIHTGYIHFVHEAAFAAFGIKLLSLRYPLIAAAFLQSCLVFLIVARRDVLLGLVAAVGATAFGTIQYLNAQPSWYCALFVTLIAFLFTYFREERWTIITAGLLVGLVFFFRQITGVFVAMGVVTYLLARRDEGVTGRDAWLARGVLGLMLVGTVLYVLSATKVSGLVLFGIWPIMLLIQAIAVSRTSTKRVFEITAKLALGFFAASVPILIYHLAHGSMRTFIDDTMVRAINIQKLAYLKWATYMDQQALALSNVVAHRSFHEVVNGIFWFFLPLIGLVTGALTIKSFKKHGSGREVGAAPILAVFYGLVAIFQQIPIYLCYTLPVMMAGLFWLSTKWSRRPRLSLVSVAIVFSAIAIYYQAAQPLTRLLKGVIAGERVALVPATNLDRVGLWVDPDSLKTYSEVIAVIKANSQPNETIFVLPYNPELYFLAERKNPFRFWNTAVGIRPGKEEQYVFDVLKSTPPRLVIIAPRDRNNTPTSQEIISYVQREYGMLTTVGPFEIYRSP
jgi:hypothetical protein